jgi:hypothetical protein
MASIEGLCKGSMPSEVSTSRPQGTLDHDIFLANDGHTLEAVEQMRYPLRNPGIQRESFPKNDKILENTT